MHAMKSVALSTVALGLLTQPTSAQGDLHDRINRDLDLNASDVVEVALDGEVGAPVRAALRIGGQWAVLDLAPHSVRAAGFELVAQDADGTLRPVEPTEPRTLRGRVVGDAGSTVAASLLDDGLHARIRLGGGVEFWLQPLPDQPAAAANLYLLYRDDNVVLDGHRCGADDIPGNLSVPVGDLQPPRGGPEALSIAELACDADFEYYLSYGSNVTAVGNRIESVVNTMNLQYESQVDITHQLTAILVRTSSSQPYTSTDAVTLLNQFRNTWLANHGNIQRDLAQLFTGKEINGGTIGIAWVGVVCTSFAFSVVQSDFNNNFSCATDLSAHECGHNWNAPHCSCPSHTMNPFITCANNFTSGTVSIITSFRNSRTCLTTGGGGNTVTLFEDGFESGNFSAGGWAIQNSDARVHRSARRTGRYGARLRRTTWIERAVDTSGFPDVRLEYSRRTRGLDSGEFLYVEWWNGSSWQNVESTQSTGWADVGTDLPAAAGDNAAFRIRFRTNASSTRERGDVDDVRVIGTN